MSIHEDVLTAWGEAVHQALCADEAYRILDGCGHEGLTFLAGGCWVLAEALRRLAGGALWAVYDPRGRVDHVPWPANARRGRRRAGADDVPRTGVARAPSVT